MDNVEKFLSHYGVKGMRWGVTRKNTDSGGYKVVSISDEAKARAAAQKKAKEQGLDSLSNKEIQDAVTRMNLEQQYSRLTSTPQGQSAIQRGNKQVKSVLDLGNTVNQAISFANSPAGKALRKGLTGI